MEATRRFSNGDDLNLQFCHCQIGSELRVPFNLTSVLAVVPSSLSVIADTLQKNSIACIVTLAEKGKSI